MENKMDKIDEFWKIRPIRANEWAEAKNLIYEEAHELMEPQMPLASFIDLWEGWNVLTDLNDIQKNYLDNDGVFLVVEIDGRIVGTGAFHRYCVGEVFSVGGRLQTSDESLRSGDGVCEVHRIMLLPECRGKKMGYALLIELIRRAREMGYTKMVLWTDPIKLCRAVDFYHHLGFTDLPIDGTDPDELWMGLDIRLPV